MAALELGVPGQMLPPAGKAADFARRNEEAGFDAVWWADHLMGWHPDTLWSPDVTPLAERQPNPHLYFDPLVMMGVVGQQTERLRVGVVVTDAIRRPAAPLAQTMLTLDHLTEGRAILGLGSGERLNVEPYGLPFDRPVTRLSEAIDVIRLLWEADGPVSYEGRFERLQDAVLGLQPHGERTPPIWLAAHGPRMLALTGRKGDGWLPTKMPVGQWAAGLDTIRAEAKDAGRSTDDLTPGLLAYVLVGPDEETVEELTTRPLVRALCVLLPSQVFRDLGVEPPLDVVAQRSPAGTRGSGFHDFVPTRVPRDEALAIVDAIPPAVVRHYAFCGTVEQVAEQIKEYEERGLEHLILWNITPFAEPSMSRWSFSALAELRDALKGVA